MNEKNQLVYRTMTNQGAETLNCDYIEHPDSVNRTNDGTVFVPSCKTKAEKKRREKKRFKNRKGRRQRAIKNFVRRGGDSHTYHVETSTEVSFKSLYYIGGSMIANMQNTFQSCNREERFKSVQFMANMICTEFPEHGYIKQKKPNSHRLALWLYCALSMLSTNVSINAFLWHDMVNKYDEYKWTRDLVSESGCPISHGLSTTWCTLKWGLKNKSNEKTMGIPYEIWDIIFSYINCFPSDMDVIEPWVSPIIVHGSFLVYNFMPSAKKFRDLLRIGVTNRMWSKIEMYHEISEYIDNQFTLCDLDTGVRSIASVMGALDVNMDSMSLEFEQFFDVGKLDKKRVHTTYSSKDAISIYLGFKDIRQLPRRALHQVFRFPLTLKNFSFERYDNGSSLWIGHPKTPWLYSAYLRIEDFVQPELWCKKCQFYSSYSCAKQDHILPKAVNEWDDESIFDLQGPSKVRAWKDLSRYEKEFYCTIRVPEYDCECTFILPEITIKVSGMIQPVEVHNGIWNIPMYEGYYGKFYSIKKSTRFYCKVVKLKRGYYEKIAGIKYLKPNHSNGFRKCCECFCCRDIRTPMLDYDPYDD